MKWRSEWIAIGLFTGSAFLLYQVSVLFFLMAVPLLLLGKRWGRTPLLYGGSALLLMILIQVFIRTRGIDTVVLRRFFLMMELAYPLSILAGVAVLFHAPGRTLYRLLWSTFLVLLISLPIAGYYTGNQEVVGFLKEQVALIFETLKSGLDGNAATEGSLLFLSMDVEAVYEFITHLFVRNYLFSYFVVMALSWLVTKRLYARMVGRLEAFSLVNFRVPEQMLWPVLTAWAGVLLEVTVGIPWFGFLFWNYGMILLFIFGLQGIGIMKFLFERYGVSRLIQTLVVFSAAIVFLTPRINLILIVGVPLLGLSEYWVHYRDVGDRS